MDFGGFEDADGGGQVAVDGHLKVGERERVLEGKCRNLGEGMNAGVGAPRTGHVDVLLFNAGNEFFEEPLDGGEAGLDLPAMEIGAIVGKLDADAPGQFPILVHALGSECEE